MSESAGPASYGRVEDDGTVFVITSAGERRVGQVPDADKSEALAFFVRRFESLETEVELLVNRVASATVSPEDARKSVNHLRTAIANANAVGDLEGLAAKLDELAGQLAIKHQENKAHRAQQHEQARAAKEALVAEAEELAASEDWRGGIDRFQALLNEWRALPRIDRTTDEALWHQFSAARSSYTRRRKAQTAGQNERRAEARRAKERIIEQARQIAGSTDWSATAAEFRDLMQSWKAAGGASRDVDNRLWAEFRGLQDQFFSARSAAFEQEDAEFRSNQAAKEQLLDQAEATILPVTDTKAAREALRDFLANYNAYGKVPREAIHSLDNRVHALEQAIKAAEDDEWRRTDPEARKRAADTVEMFTEQINKLVRQAETADARGDHRKAAKTRDSIATYNQWLAQAQRALDEFSA